MESYAVIFTSVFAIGLGMLVAAFITVVAAIALPKRFRGDSEIGGAIFLAATAFAAFVITAATLGWASSRAVVDSTRTVDGPYPVISYTSEGLAAAATSSITGTMLVNGEVQAFQTNLVTAGVRDEVTAITSCVYYVPPENLTDDEWTFLPWFPDKVCTVEYNLALAL